MSAPGTGPVDTVVEFGRRIRRAYVGQVSPDEQAMLVAWSAFTVTFGATRALTHWIRDGHGPASGGMSVGGRHLHHYNIGTSLCCPGSARWLFAAANATRSIR